jgi:sucrose phosphorylase
MQPPRDETLRTLLGDLYPNDSSGDGQELSSQLLQILSQSSGDGDMAEPIDRWAGSDVVLITYADTIGDEGVPGLQALKSFVNRHLHAFAAVVHVLPFCNPPVMVVLRWPATRSSSSVSAIGATSLPWRRADG